MFNKNKFDNIILIILICAMVVVSLAVLFAPSKPSQTSSTTKTVDHTQDIDYHDEELDDLDDKEYAFYDDDEYEYVDEEDEEYIEYEDYEDLAPLIHKIIENFEIDDEIAQTPTPVPTPTPTVGPPRRRETLPISTTPNPTISPAPTYEPVQDVTLRTPTPTLIITPTPVPTVIKTVSYEDINYDKSAFSIVSAVNNVLVRKGDYDNKHVNFYYNQLNDDQKALYLKLEGICRNYESTIKFDDVSQEDCCLVVFSLYYDYPEYYWIYPDFSWWIRSETENIYGIQFDVPSDAKERIEKVDMKVRELFAEMDYIGLKYNYEKLKYFNDWIIRNCEYEHNEHDQDMTSMFLDGISVCAGYSKAFMYLCKKANIDCTCVYGFSSTDGAHLWNIVKLYDNYYWVDVTWADRVTGTADAPLYTYFLVDDTQFFNSHTVSDKYDFGINTGELTDLPSFPKCSDDSLDYYKLIGAYFDSYDEKELQEYFRSYFEEGCFKDIEIKFKEQSQFERFRQDIISSSYPIIFKALDEVYPNCPACISRIEKPKENYMVISIVPD